MYDQDSGFIHGDTYVDVLVLRQDGFSEKWYGRLQIFLTLVGALFGGGIVFAIIDRQRQHNAADT